MFKNFRNYLVLMFDVFIERWKIFLQDLTLKIQLVFTRHEAYPHYLWYSWFITNYNSILGWSIWLAFFYSIFDRNVVIFTIFISFFVFAIPKKLIDFYFRNAELIKNVVKKIISIPKKVLNIFKEVANFIFFFIQIVVFLLLIKIFWNAGFFDNIFVYFKAILIWVGGALKVCLLNWLHFVYDVIVNYFCFVFKIALNFLNISNTSVFIMVLWSFLLKGILFMPFILFIFLLFFSASNLNVINCNIIYYSLFSLLLSVLLVAQKVILCSDILRLDLGIWFYCGGFEVSWGFVFDFLSVMMLVVITIVSLVVQMYSIMYMGLDKNGCRFIAYLNLFAFFMFVLILADNLLVLFVGWEGVGVCSFLLISFWTTRVSANKAAFKALIINRIADIGLLLGIALTFALFGSVDYDIIFNLMPKVQNLTINIYSFNIKASVLLCYLLFIGAAGKSAQLGFHLWLPDAMEGPTPVSSLIHAATMVTAGVFLLIRCSSLFIFAPDVLCCIIILGSLTAFFGATVAAVQKDIKKIIAYSTCSQLGLMFVACGELKFNIALFHLINHAFFKALLFLCAGLIIRGLQGEQDIRYMGGLRHKSPEIYYLMLVASLSLAGFPFMSGFFSKEALLSVLFLKLDGSLSVFVYILALFTTFLSAFYSMRLLLLVFYGDYRGSQKKLLRFDKIPDYLRSYLYVLFFGSLFSGYLLKSFFIGFNSQILEKSNWNFSLYNNFGALDAEFLPAYIKLIPLIVSFFGMFVAVIVYIVFKKYSLIWFMWKKIYKFFLTAWSVSFILNRKVIKLFIWCCYAYFFLLIDKFILEKLGFSGISKIFTTINTYLNSLTFFNYTYKYLNLILLFFFYALLFIKIY